MNVVGRIEWSGNIETTYVDELTSWTGGHATVEDGEVVVTINITRL